MLDAGVDRADWPDWPDYGLVDDLLPTLEAWQVAGLPFVVATLVQVEGSSPRPVGAEMAVNARGEAVGYVSGGCVEAAVATEALDVLASGAPRLLDYGAGSPALDIQLACGGRIHIWLARPDDADHWLAAWRAARTARRTLSDVLSWRDATGAQRQLERIRTPPTRLVLVGGDPVTLALARLAVASELEVWLLRPNGPESPPTGLKLAHYDRRPIHSAVADLPVDRWTAVYTLTHDADLDHVVLCRALTGGAYCVGALGSRRKAALRNERLRLDGISAELIDTLHSPAGLDIGARTPAHIAAAILAEAIANRRE